MTSMPAPLGPYRSEATRSVITFARRASPAGALGWLSLALATALAFVLTVDVSLPTLLGDERLVYVLVPVAFSTSIVAMGALGEAFHACAVCLGRFRGVRISRDALELRDQGFDEAIPLEAIVGVSVERGRLLALRLAPSTRRERLTYAVPRDLPLDELLAALDERLGEGRAVAR